MQLPKAYKEKMLNLLNEEYDDYIESFYENRHYGLRVNILKINPYDLQKKIDEPLQNIPWCNEGFYYTEGFRPSKTPYYHAGLYYIQEPSAMSATSMLEISKGDYVLDLCAAPGGKSTHIGSKLRNCGLLISNDINTKRTSALIKNIELFGIKNAIVLNEKPSTLANNFTEFFDKILVDAPCSGEGMFRKDQNAIKAWNQYKSEQCQVIQRQLLDSAALMLKPNGLIMYSTCTFDPKENEEIIQHFLNEHKDFEICKINHNNLFDHGKANWVNNGSSDLNNCARLWPHKINGEGHFLALLHKKSISHKTIMIKANESINNKSALEYYYVFLKDYMNIELFDNLKLIGNYLYSLPNGNYNLNGLRTMRFGWFLGELKTKRFEPSQALALAIKKEDAKYTIDFDAKSDEIIKYLKGETLFIDAHDGWNLICVDGYTVGWAKLQNGRLKNKYLKSWRWE